MTTVMGNGPLERLLSALTHAGIRYTRGDGETVLCPAHEDHNPSLSLSAGTSKDGRPIALMCCQAGCSVDDICAALGMSTADLFTPRERDTPWPILAIYRYRNECGIEVYQKIRIPADAGGRTFKIRRLGPDGKWIYRNVFDGVTKVLYRLPELIAGVSAGRRVWIVEGERDADRLASVGEVATTNIEGASDPRQRPKWREDYNTAFAGAHITVIADNDPPGFAHARHVVTSLTPLTASVRLLRSAVTAAHADISDHLDAGLGLDDLVPVSNRDVPPGVVAEVGRLTELNSVEVVPDDSSLPSEPDGDVAYRIHEYEVARELRRLKARDEAQKRYRAELAGPVVLPTPVLLTDLLAEPDADTRYRIDGLLPVGGRVVLAAQFKAGKAVDITEPILTEHGWTTMRSVREGDRVHAPDGSLVDVISVSPIMTERPCYRVDFSDGRSIVVDGEHLWTVFDSGRQREVTEETRVMAGQVVRWEGTNNRHSRYSVRTTANLDRPERDLPINPYLLGAWLGDGTSRAAELTVGDEDIKEMTSLVTSTGAKIVSMRRDKTAWRLRLSIGGAVRDGFESRCRRLGVWGNKHVPESYLLGSEKQRLAILQGLMDTDGCACGGNGRTTRLEYTSILRELADSVLFLARSLGWKASLRKGIAKLNGRHIGHKFRVSWTAYADEQPFLLTRKLAKLHGRPQRWDRRSGTVKITAITPVPSRPVRCIQVDHPSHLYLVGHGLIPTHNSTAVGNLVRCLADGGLFLGAHQVHPAVGRVVLLDNEMPRETIKLWLRDQGIIRTGNVAVIPCRGSVSSFNILDSDVCSRWVELIRAYGPGVLLLDCLRPVMDALGLDENHDAGQVLGAMDEIAERAGASELFVVHHMGHSNERSRGDSRIRDWPDVEWRLVRKDDDPSSQRFFTAYGRDVDVSETALEYDPRTRHLILAGGSRVDVAAHSLIPGLMDLLADQPGMTKASIEDRLMDAGVSRSVVRATLAEAIDQGLVRGVPGPKTSVLHYLNPTKRTNQDVGQSVSSPGRRSSGGLEKQVREASSNSRPPEDQTVISPDSDSSSPGRRQAADHDGELGRVKAEGPAEPPPVGGAPAGGLNGQVSGLEEDPKKTISGGLELGSPNKARQDLGPGGDAWVHAYLTTAPQTAERIAVDLDATPGAVHAALARLATSGNAQRHPGRPDESAQWSLPGKQ